MVSGEEETLQNDATVYHGIMDQPGANNDHDDADDETKTIHPRECKEMIIPKFKLRGQWRLKNQVILEQTTKTPNANKNQHTDKYVKNSAKTEIMQLIEKHPEMPEELELNRGDRKNYMQSRRIPSRNPPTGTANPIYSAAGTESQIHMRELRKNLRDADTKRIHVRKSQNVCESARKAPSRTDAKTAKEYPEHHQTWGDA